MFLGFLFWVVMFRFFFFFWNFYRTAIFVRSIIIYRRIYMLINLIRMH